MSTPGPTRPTRLTSTVNRKTPTRSARGWTSAWSWVFLDHDEPDATGCLADHVDQGCGQDGDGGSGQDTDRTDHGACPPHLIAVEPVVVQSNVGHERLDLVYLSAGVGQPPQQRQGGHHRGIEACVQHDRQLEDRPQVDPPYDPPNPSTLTTTHPNDVWISRPLSPGSGRRERPTVLFW
jgi:hypothetical protein